MAYLSYNLSSVDRDPIRILDRLVSAFLTLEPSKSVLFRDAIFNLRETFMMRQNNENINTIIEVLNNKLRVYIGNHFTNPTVTVSESPETLDNGLTSLVVSVSITLPNGTFIDWAMLFGLENGVFTKIRRLRG